ncbi:MAG: hypothetical protein EOO89_16415, partial [Pedobacter sp.]
MEELKAYIESGILELYVLGQLSAEEMTEVEAMANKFALVKDELNAIELALEQYASLNKIEPAVTNKNAILNKIAVASEGTDEAKILPLPSAGRKFKTLSFALAACLGLLVISVVALFLAHNKLEDANSQIALLKLQTQQYSRSAN